VGKVGPEIELLLLSPCERQPMNWKTFRVLALIGVVSAGLIALLFVEKPFSHKLVLKSYFMNGVDLRAGALVRVAGIDVGTVKTVRVRPELKETPVEVVMVLTPPYELKIPTDSIAELRTAGLLGDTYVGIDMSGTIGPPVDTNGVLKTRPPTEVSNHEMLKRLDQTLTQVDRDLQKARAAGSADARHASGNPPR
jgi:phospholipid/cholesterol/gamma-HCH transport system substrate-binding protein